MIRDLQLSAVLLVCFILGACDGQSTVAVTTTGTDAPLATEVVLDERNLLTPDALNAGNPELGFALAAGEQVNLARGQTAVQSSVSFGGVAGRAVDGNAPGSVYTSGSVTATDVENQPWWQVDLAQRYQLSTINLHNRADCCAERLSNFYVFVSDTDMRDRTMAELLSDPDVWHVHQTAAVAANGNASFNTATTGRFVRVQKATRGILSLAEVQVYGANLAAGHTASQSSTYQQATANLAVDDNTDGTFTNGSVAATLSQNQPWWQLDLGRQTDVGRIKLFNRRDCCGRDLAHFYVFVSETDMRRALTRRFAC